MDNVVNNPLIGFLSYTCIVLVIGIAIGSFIEFYEIINTLASPKDTPVKRHLLKVIRERAMRHMHRVRHEAQHQMDVVSQAYLQQIDDTMRRSG